MPARGHSEQWIRDKLARAEAQQAQLIEAAAELAAELADLRRALSPGSARHTKPRQPRRTETTTDRWLRAVKVMAVVAACLVAVLAAMAPVRGHRERFSPACNVLCSRPVSHHSPTPRKTG